ncbi:MAG: hypothetical protein IJS14_01760 [Lentisphaeria bacterium]|nr:hypothetical protein [Lentisphaeria bacterium]
MLTREQLKNVTLAAERLSEKMFRMRRAHKEIKLGETAAPTPSGKVDDDPLRGPVHMEWPGLIEPERSQFAAVVDEILADLPKTDTSKFVKLSDDNLWVWGGPTPYWGGSMADDTLVRGAKFFDAKNGVYVYGPTDDKMMQLHSGFKRILCQVNSQCRTPGAQGEMNDEINAEELSRLSLKYPNIVGAMCDDVATYFRHLVLPEAFEARSRALKKYNDKLKMYGVIYVHELAEKDFTPILPYLDTVNLWFWHMDEILDYDRNILLCQERFPGKPILQGIFLHDYGISDAGTLPQLLVYQLDKAREYMTRGIVEGVVILGDREIMKWPESSAAVRNYLLDQ